MVTLLIEAGYDDATITLIAGHRDIKSLRNYHNLRGSIGLNKLKRMFTGPKITNVEAYKIQGGNLVDELRENRIQES